MTRYTRQVADRVKGGPQSGPLRQPRMVQGLMTSDVLSSLGPETPSLVHEMDSHTIYFGPSWLSKEYAARAGEELLVAMPRIARVASVGVGLGGVGDALAGETPEFGVVEMAEAAEVVDGAVQAFNRMVGASYVAFSDDAARDLAETGLVRAYPDGPRITIASSVIQQSQVVTETAQLQILDLLNDSLRVVAYPGQAQEAERVYRMARGVSDTFLETAVGEALTGEQSASAANVLQAAQAQGIPLVYVDANRLDVLARLDISTQARAFIMDAVQRGYGVMVPERMVAWEDGETIAWWQLDPETGEMIDVGEDGTHQFLVTLIGGLKVLVAVVLILLLLLVLLRSCTPQGVTKVNMWKEFWYSAHQGNPSSPPAAYKQALKAAKACMQGKGPCIVPGP